MVTANLSPSADTYLTEAGGTHGSNTAFSVGQIVVLGSPVISRGIMRFDLSSYPGIPFTSAILTITLSAAFFPDAPHQVSLHEVTTTDWTEADATWTAANSADNWAASGGDFDSTAFSTATVSNSATSLQLDIAPLIAARTTSNVDFVIKLPEGAGHDNHYFTAYSKEYGVSGSRPVLALVYPNLPVIERIANSLKRRLDRVTEDNGYSIDLSAVRPTRRGVSGLSHGKTKVTQSAGATRTPEHDLPGNPPAIAWTQEFVVTIHVAAEDDDETPVDTVANLAAADAELAITTEQLTGDWAQFDGLALYAQQVDRDIQNTGEFSVVTLRYEITYRHAENNPYSVR